MLFIVMDSNNIIHKENITFGSIWKWKIYMVKYFIMLLFWVHIMSLIFKQNSIDFLETYA